MAYSKLVRHATARVIAAIADIELPVNQWGSLLPSLTQAATSNVVTERETGSFILCTILEKVGAELQSQLPDFFKLFSTLAHDNDSLEVRVNSVRYEFSFYDVLVNEITILKSSWNVR